MADLKRLDTIFLKRKRTWEADQMSQVEKTQKKNGGKLKNDQLGGGGVN